MTTKGYAALAWISGIGAFVFLIYALSLSIWCNLSREENTILWTGFGLCALISLIGIIGYVYNKNKEEEELEAEAKRAIRLKELQKEQSKLREYKIVATSEGKMIYYLIVRYPHTKQIAEFKVDVEEYYLALETKKHILYHFYYVPKEKRKQYDELERKITILMNERYLKK